MVGVKVRLRVYAAVLIAVILIGVAGFVAFEGLSALDAFYLCIVTLATVGYGDIHPTTDAGKILAIFVILGGVGSFVGVAANSLELWLEQREREVRLQKLGMITGAFYSELGTPLLRTFSARNPRVGEIVREIVLTSDTSDAEFARLAERLKEHTYTIDLVGMDLKELQQFLISKGNFLLRLLENPMLLEHEAFTELLRAVFHLAEELSYREEFASLPPADRAHLAVDIGRAYRLLAIQWVSYMEYLKGNHPYLFSLALRVNPFNPEASAVVREGS